MTNLPVRTRLAGFMRTLRDNGLGAGLAETEAAARMLASGEFATIDRFQAGLRAICAGNRDEWEKFDAIFEAYWRARGMRSALRLIGASPADRRPPRLLPGHPGSEPADGAPDRTERRAGTEQDNPADGRARRSGASAAEALTETDLRHIADPDQIAQAHALAERLALKMRRSRARRARAQRNGERLDLRRTIQRSVAHGGLPLDLVRKRRRRRQIRLVVLLDASGSMSLYAAAFLRFIHGVLEAFERSDAFVFHTRLIHVAAALRERDPERAVARLSLMAQGFSGGTRIGESLATFNRHHAARALGGRGVAVILSDGYDTGPPEALAVEMAALRRRCRRVVWLNPMLGWDGYAPEAGGMRAALPHVDLFAPAHNLASLAALEGALARL